MDNFVKDLRYAIRILAKNRSFTAIAVIALALGIGANTAIFSVVNAVLLRELPFENADQLVQIWSSNQAKGYKEFPFSAPDFVDVRAQSQAFQQVAAYNETNFTLTGGDQPERVPGYAVTHDFFQMLGVKPVVGRLFLPEDEKKSTDTVAILSYRFARSRFGDEAVGKNLVVDSRSVTVVGVLPPEFQFKTGEAEIWLPLYFSPEQLTERGSHYLEVVGRIKSGIGPIQAQEDLAALASRLSQQYPDTNLNKNMHFVKLREHFVGSVRLSLIVLLVAVGMVLLIACVNVANLLLARAADRQKEIAIRIAMGATRTRIIRQLLTESVLIALLGGIVAALLALWSVDLMKAVLPDDIPFIDTVSLDARVLTFNFVVALLTGLIFGLVPALQSANQELNNTLKEGGRRSGAVQSSRLRALLVVSEVALSFVLLVGAGLMIKSFLKLQDVSAGFNPENLVTISLSLPETKYTKPEQWRNFIVQTMERVKALPGIESAEAISNMPMTGSLMRLSFQLEGGEKLPPSKRRGAGFHVTGPDYFRTMQIPIIKGRVFTASDTDKSQLVVVVNEAFVRTYLPNDDPIGKKIEIGYGDPVPRVIVGVVGDVRHKGLDAKIDEEFYTPYTQTPMPFTNLVLRTPLNAQDVATMVRGEMAVIDKDMPLNDVKTGVQLLSASVMRPRFRTLFLGIFAALALLLSAVGIYGVISYSVEQRTHEIGVRMALGAQARDVMRMILGQGMVLLGIGMAIGVIGAWALTRVIESLLFNVSVHDPLTFAVIFVLLTLVALIACYIPARRAMKVDPMVALRYE